MHRAHLGATGQILTINLNPKLEVLNPKVDTPSPKMVLLSVRPCCKL